MKDIKQLYLAAKQHGRQEDIDSYIECVRDFLENNPYQYMSNLEYIISSSLGLSTLKEFVDRNGISIGSYNEIVSCLDNGIKRCNRRGYECEDYHEALRMMESFKYQYQNCFAMFENYKDGIGDQYIEAYYKNFPVLRKVTDGKVNLSGMISKFGEACIPDMLIYTSKFGNPDVVLESLKSEEIDNSEPVKFMVLKINNSKNASVKTGKWKDPGSKFYDQLLNASPTGNTNKPKNTSQYLQEAYLIAPVDNIKYGSEKTSYSKSGCKYPHHVIKDGQLVVHEVGLKAAYSRAKQMGIFSGDVKEHLERHYKELGLFKDSNMNEFTDYNSDGIFYQWVYECTTDIYEESGKFPTTETICLDRTFSPKYFMKILKDTDDQIISMIKERVKDKDDLDLILHGVIRDHSGSGNIHKKGNTYIGKDISVCLVSASVETKYKSLDKLLSGIARDLRPKFEKEHPGYTLRYDGASKNKFYLDLDQNACKELWDGCNKPKIRETNRVIKLKDKTLETKVKSIKESATSLYRESVLTGNENIVMEYSVEDIENIKNLIAFKEYQITCMENTSKALELQNEVYSLYEAFSDVLDEDIDDSVVPMLPQSNVTYMNDDILKEYSSKKTGDIPEYLKRNHDLSYGEKEPEDTTSKQKDDDSKEPSLDDFKRPSSDGDKEDQQITPFDYSQLDNNTKSDSTVDSNHDVDSDDEEGKEPKSHHINNYYYYTYTNSNNRNSNSYNKNNQDDHSTAKRINSSDNITNAGLESVSFADVIAKPLTEMPMLPTAYYSMYNEATCTLINEANELVKVNSDSKEKNEDNPKEEPKESKPGLLDRVKEMIRKFINFLIEMYEKVFPRSVLDFEKLEKKYRKSEKVSKALKDNHNILKVLDMKIPHISGAAKAFGDLADFLKTGKAPKNHVSEYKQLGSTRLVIYYGSYSGKNGVGYDNPNTDMGFRIASNCPVNSDSKRFAFMGKDLARISTYLSESSLLQAFGIIGVDENGHRLTIYEIKNVLKYAKMKVNGSIDLWMHLDDRKKMVELLKALTSITDHVYKTMNQAYHGAVTLLKMIEADKFEGNPNFKFESPEPWKLNIFGENQLYTESVDTPYQRWWRRENRDVMKIGGKLIKEAHKYFADNIGRVIKSNKKYALLDNPKAIKEIKDHAGKNISFIGRGEIVIFDGKQEYDSIFDENRSESPNHLIAECFFIMMKQFKKDKPEMLKYFEVPLSSKGWIDAVDDIPGISLLCKEPPKRIVINIGGKKLAFKSVANGGWIGNEKATKFSQVPASILSFLINEDKITNDKIGIGVAIDRYINSFKGEIANINELSPEERLAKYVKPDQIYFKGEGDIGLRFTTPLDGEHGFGININSSMKIKYGQDDVAFESVYCEDVGDADDKRPTSDNPIQDTMTDIDRNVASAQQAVKKKVQGAVNAARTIVKPFKRTAQWLTNMVSNWKDSNENDIKERLADPHSRSALYSAIRTAIKVGSLWKAGLLLNPIVLFLTITKKISDGRKEFRLRNEMIGELKAELGIIDAKIQDADRAGDNKAKYQLMRFKNELNKKLIRVGGTKEMAKMV